MLDVLVIGGGLAGAIAALSARRAGAHVALARRSWGATALSFGGLDIAYSPALSPAAQAPRTIAEHVMDIIAHRPHHPYGVLGLEETLRGIRRGYDVLVPALASAELGLGELNFEADNLSLPSSLGTAQPVATAQRSHLGMDLARPLRGRWGVASFHGSSYFVASRLVAGLSYDAVALTGTRPELEAVAIAYDARKPPALLARELDDIANVDELARALAPAAKGFSGMLVPPILGLDRHCATQQRLCEAVGIPIVEALAHLPSVPGVRLQRALDRVLAASGVELVIGRAHV